jgi:hypothetical protein
MALVRCYTIPSADGSGSIRIRAGKRPDPKTAAALQNLFAAALKRCEEEQLAIATRPDVAAGAAPAFLVTLGLEDWEMEKRLIAKEHLNGKKRSGK